MNGLLDEFNDFVEIFREKIVRLEEENKRLVEENNLLENELNYLYGENIDIFNLNLVKTSSELIKKIEDRYSNIGMKVVKLKKNHDGNTFTMEVGRWIWKGKKRFIGKQYFKKKLFSSGDCDGYDDTNLFVSELLGIKTCGAGGIATNWYRYKIPILEGFVIDKEI